MRNSEQHRVEMTACRQLWTRPNRTVAHSQVSEQRLSYLRVGIFYVSSLNRKINLRQILVKVFKAKD